MSSSFGALVVVFLSAGRVNLFGQESLFHLKQLIIIMIIKIIEIKCKHSALTPNLIHSRTRLFSMATLPTEA